MTQLRSTAAEPAPAKPKVKPGIGTDPTPTKNPNRIPIRKPEPGVQEKPKA